MNLPGFTAEASLFKGGQHYQLVLREPGQAGGDAVVPQQCSCRYDPYSHSQVCCCNIRGYPGFCWRQGVRFIPFE